MAIDDMSADPEEVIILKAEAISPSFIADPFSVLFKHHFLSFPVLLVKSDILETSVLLAPVGR